MLINDSVLVINIIWCCWRFISTTNIQTYSRKTDQDTKGYGSDLISEGIGKCCIISMLKVRLYPASTAYNKPDGLILCHKPPENNS